MTKLSLFVSLLFSVFAQAQVDCEGPLLPGLDLALVREVKTVNASWASSHRVVDVAMEFSNGDQIQASTVPILNGIRLTRRLAMRAGRPLGYVGRTDSNRVVILEPVGQRRTPPQAIARAYFILDALAKRDLAVPILGIALFGEGVYFVRPALAGAAPLTHMGALEEPTRLADLMDLESIAEAVESLYPAYIHWGILPDPSWRDRFSDSEFEHEKMPLQFRVVLGDFLDQIKFVRNGSGLRLETLPALVTDYPWVDVYPIVREKDGKSWRFERWHWYRYLLAARLADSEKPIFYDWIRQGKRVEWMMRFQFLARLIRQSPEFLAPRVRMTGGTFVVIADSDKPYVRPSELAFRDRSSLVYHFKKHGPGMGLISAEDYLEAAKNFVVGVRESERLYFERQNGDLVLTDPRADRLAIFTANGVLKTFFQPSIEFHGHGHNPYYIYEQLLKDNGFLNE